MTGQFTGAHALLKAAQAAGARVCFANPGTTELGIVRAFDDIPGIRPILGLFEGVCTGAADGYMRVSGVPALTLLHLGPGLANGLANLHNARRAHSAIVNIVGDHATWHLPFDAPLTSDIDSLARPVSKSIVRVSSAFSITQDVYQAFDTANAPPSGVVSVIAPSDLMDASIQLPKDVMDDSARPAVRRRPAPVSDAAVASIAGQFAQPGFRPAILLGGSALSDRGLRAAARVADKTGARLLMESYPAIVPLGGGLPRLERLAYFPRDMQRQLAGHKLILAGARSPVSYFGYRDEPSEPISRGDVAMLSGEAEDGTQALEALAEWVSATHVSAASDTMEPISQSTGTLTPVEAADELVLRLPEGAIVSLEGSTLGGPYLERAHRAHRHWVMTNTGGAIGQGIPCGVGAACARPEARVVCLQSDGSALYTLQALWTLARESLNVTVLICANHRYGILQRELQRSRADLTRPAIERMTSLAAPKIDWVALATGYGVPARRVDTRRELSAALTASLAAAGPSLIEAQFI